MIGARAPESESNVSNNADLIAEARAHTYASRSPHPLAFRLADALEAADRDRERLDALWAETTHEAIRETDRANAVEKRATEAEAEVVRLRSQRASHG